VLDFKKIKQKEREAAKQLFKTREGKTQLKDIQRKAKTFVPGTPLPEATNKNTNAAGLTPEQVSVQKLPGTPLPEATNKNANAAGLTPEQVSVKN
jgi:U2 small nuclear ribonucleoprotein A'